MGLHIARTQTYISIWKELPRISQVKMIVIILVFCFILIVFYPTPSQSIIHHYCSAFFTSILALMSTKTSCKKAREEFKSTESKFLKCKVQSSKSQRIEPCYPIKKLRAFFTAKMISGILNCRCEKCSQKYPEVRESAEAIQGKENESYISVFAFLYKLKRLQLIHKFLSNKYTDQGLSNPEFIQKHFINSSHDCILSEQDFNDLFESSDYWEYQEFFRFFIPALPYSHRLRHRSIPNDQLLPFNIIRKIGEGGYSVVYEAFMLDGYHDFQGITVF